MSWITYGYLYYAIFFSSLACFGTILWFIGTSNVYNVTAYLHLCIFTLGLRFQNFPKMGGGGVKCQILSIKRVGKNEGGVFLKRMNHLFSHQLTLMSSFSVCGACVLLVYTISISVLCISQKRLVLLNLISRNFFSACE